VQAGMGRPPWRSSVKIFSNAFVAEFGGEWFDPKDRGKGIDWNKWYKSAK